LMVSGAANYLSGHWKDENSGTTYTLGCNKNCAAASGRTYSWSGYSGECRLLAPVSPNPNSKLDCSSASFGSEKIADITCQGGRRHLNWDSGALYTNEDLTCNGDLDEVPSTDDALMSEQATCSGNYHGHGSGRACDWHEADGTYRNGCGTDPKATCESYCTTDISSHGCNHGSSDNTCGFNEYGDCVYASAGTAETDALMSEQEGYYKGYYLCPGSQHGWKGHANGGDCGQGIGGGCSYDICEQQIHASPKLANRHCYTKAQVDAGNTGTPLGCQRPPDDSNTCAEDEYGFCAYAANAAGLSI
jgi:hypothetical protein